uniref:Centrosomal protein of 135 kDa n=1 Tax=Strigamia maritima TaxID=126957 RepID=T1JBR2_STRMM
MAATRFRALRKKLDQLGYKLPLSTESTCLVEKLVCELEKLKLHRSPVKSRPATAKLRNKVRKLEHENCDLRFINSQYMYKMRELEKENCSRNERILQLQEKEAQAIIQIRGQDTKRRECAFRRQKMDITNSLPFSTCAELPAYVHIDDPYVADMLEVADKRITQLRKELANLQSVVEDSKYQNENLNRQLAVRDNEIDRLNQHFAANEPIPTCVDDTMTRASHEKELELCRYKMSKFEDEIENLQLQVCNALKQKDISENCVKQLTERNKNLEQELHQFKNITDRIQEDKQKMLRTSASEIGQSTGKLKKVLREIDKLHSELCTVRKENLTLKCDKEKLEGIIESREEEIYRLENETALLNDKLSQLTSIKSQLESQVSSLKQTQDCSCACKCGKRPYFARFEENLDEIQRIYGKSDSCKRNDFLRFASDIHPQPPVVREHKGPSIKCRHKVNLSAAKLSQPTVAFGRRAITPPPRLQNNTRPRSVRFSSSPSPEEELINQQPSLQKHDGETKDLQSASQIKALVDERDYYQRCFESLRNRGEGVSSPPTRDTKLESTLAGNVKELIKERDDLKKHIGKLEEQNVEFQSLLKELKDEKEQIQKQFRETEKERRQLEQEVSVGKAAAERSLSRRLERRNEVVCQDLQTVIMERDTLRDKLKLATETQIQERRRLDKQISCFQNKLREKENEFADICAQSNAYKTQVNQLEEELQLKCHELAEANDERAQQRFSIAELRLFSLIARVVLYCLTMFYFKLRNVEKFQNNLDETEHKLRLKEASGVEKYAKNMEEEIMKLRMMHRDYTCEMDGLRRTVSALDREKDQLQMEVDARTERLAALEDKLKRSDRSANDLKITCNTLEVNLDRQRDDICSRDKEIMNLRRELEMFEKEIQQVTFSQNSLAARSHTLQDDLATMARENQRLHAELDACTLEKQELKLQIQTYVAQVTKFEELLCEKDQERMDILEQFQNITLEANSLETQNNHLESETATIRVELHAKNVEVQHLQTVLGGLQQEIEQYINTQQSLEMELSQLKRTVATLDSESERFRIEKDNVQDDLTTVRNLYTQMEIDKEKLVDQLTKKETECDRLEQELVDIQNQLDGVRGEAQQGRIKTMELENLLSNNRRKEFESQLSYKDMATELRLAQEQFSDCEQRFPKLIVNFTRVQSNRETLQLRTALAEMKVELERFQRQLTNEKFENLDLQRTRVPRTAQVTS